MRGEPIEIADLVKLENLADRAVRALNIRHKSAQPPALGDYLAGRVA
jgi:hypothetical protein